MNPLLLLSHLLLLFHLLLLSRTCSYSLTRFYAPLSAAKAPNWGVRRRSPPRKFRFVFEEQPVLLRVRVRVLLYDFESRPEARPVPPGRASTNSPQAVAGTASPHAASLTVE